MLIVGINFIVIFLMGIMALRSSIRKAEGVEDHEPNWWAFATATAFIGWVVAIVLGRLNFAVHAQPYYNYMDLREYSQVDPSRMTGKQIMDAGRVHFVSNASLDLRLSTGFKNEDMYCAAPISIPGQPLQSYDFWAVGLGCCSGASADFHCGEYNNPGARSGLRLLDDRQRAFFRLAVKQSEATYQIKAKHPVFFYWTQDPTAEMEYVKNEGIKYYAIGMIVHFGWQLLCVGLALSSFFKLTRPPSM